ncbi:MAG: hypothetical protein AAB834_02960, partial [Patescibacteria group bacterium]
PAGVPDSACMLKLRTGTAATAMITPPANTTATSISNITLSGNNVGSGIHGIFMASNPTNIPNWVIQNVGIIGFTGDGIRGRLLATRWHNVYVGGNHGWGLNNTGSLAMTDSWFYQCIFNQNVLGGMNFESSATSGSLHFSGCRVERSGWNEADELAPISTNAPGIRIAGNLSKADWVACSTDANSGHGLDIDQPAGRASAVLQFVGCSFNRDGFGDMSTLGDFAAVRIRGINTNYVERITFVGCVTTTGRASDVSGEPSGYLHPKYGMWLERTTFLSINGGSIGDNHTVPVYGGVAGLGENYRALINTRIGGSGGPGKSLNVIAGGDTAERPDAWQGALYMNFETAHLEVCLDGANWTSVGP